jgi:hypothetical protein
VHARDELLKRNRHLESRDVGSGAEVRAEAEGKMAVRPAVQNADLRVGKLTVVAIGGGKGERDDVAAGDRLSVQLDVAGSVARLQRDRRRAAEELLDRARDQVWLGAKVVEIRRVDCEMVQGRGQRRRGRLVPGDEEDAHEAGDLGGSETLSVHLGLEQHANEGAAPLFDQVVDVAVVLARRAAPVRRIPRVVHAAHPGDPLASGPPREAA